MNIKVRVLKESKKEKTTRRISESLVDLINDPVMLTSLAGALGIGIVALKGILSGGGSDGGLDRVRARIKANIAHADELTSAGRGAREKAKQIKDNSMAQRLAQMKADRGIGNDEENPTGQIPLQLAPAGEGSEDPKKSGITDDVARKFIKIKNQTTGSNKGIVSNATTKMNKFIAMYPDIEAYIETKPELKKDLYEIFKRFL